MSGTGTETWRGRYSPIRQSMRHSPMKYSQKEVSFEEKEVNSEERLWEVDFLRGAAVVAMVIYHALYDLDYFGAFHVEVFSGFWLRFAQATATTFVLLVGVSLSLSSARAVNLGKSEGLWKKLVTRGLKIFALGLCVTAATYAFSREGFIIFGVLHFIGLAVILAYPFLRIDRGRTGLMVGVNLVAGANLMIGAAVILTGLKLQTMTFGFSCLMWLGFIPNGLYTFDYFPIFPWFGLVLVGIFLGDFLYKGYRRRFELPDASGSSPARLFCLLGRNSLLVYLIHQPAMIAVLYLTGLGKTGVF